MARAARGVGGATMSKRWKLVGVLAASILALSLGRADADIIVLTFEGLDNLEPVADFYDGGFGGGGSGPGPAYGIVFSDNSLAVLDLDAGGAGDIANEPSPSTVLFFLE